MSLEGNYYTVTVHTSPFEYGKEREIVSYSRRDLADVTVGFVRKLFQHRVNGGIDIRVRDCQGEFVETPSGLRLKDMPKGKITMINESWDVEEAKSLLKHVPFALNLDSVKPCSILKIDEPKRIVEAEYHALVLTFEPFDDSHKLYVGYYQTSKLAHSVAHFIIQIHQSKKVGCGFDTVINPYLGKYVEYESGKNYINISGMHHEVQSSCDDKEYLRVIKIVNEAIKNWA